MLALFSCLDWDSETSAQAGQDEGGWQTGGLCSVLAHDQCSTAASQEQDF